MAVSLLPGRISPCNSNCSGRGRDVLLNGAGCSCRVTNMSMASPLISSRAFFSTISPEAAGPSSSSCYEFLQLYPVRRFSSLLSGAEWYRRKVVITSRAFGIIGNEQRRGRLRRAYATRDTGSREEVRSQTSRNVTKVSSPQRFPTPRSDKAEEERTSETDKEEKIASGENGQPRVEAKSETFGSKLSSDTHSATNGVNAQGLKEEEEGGISGATLGSLAAGLGLIAVLGGFGAIGYFNREQINTILIQFSDFLEGYGPAGYVLFVLVYAGLEVLAIPAIPLTMSAGLLFGTTIGTVIVSIAGTIAATLAFLIARYLARDRILELAKDNKKFLAIDKAIGEDGFRVVTLLRLSPLLPFSLGNYLYGLTSVKLVPYVLGSWLGMLPGSWAYVSAGAIGRAFIQQESEQLWTGGPEQLWTVGIGLAATVFAATYVTRLAKEALKDIE
ncbi:hypothetical protein R1flu_014087 [Riccia fluitans]|uniref:VTT domain-containing protein n=1 Tax=Riccia fluitans TaxID=41844 RepID=A0ABD1YF39_9MARC